MTHRKLDTAEGLYFNPLAVARPFIQELRELHPDWLHDYEDAQVQQVSPADLMELLQSAPTHFAAGFIFGKMMALQDTQVANQIARHQSNDTYSGYGLHSIDARTASANSVPMNA